MSTQTEIIEGCFTKKASRDKWECFACGKIISTTGMNRKCAHITGTPGHGIKKCDDPYGKITFDIRAAGVALEKAAAREKAVVRENEHRLAAMAASDSQGPAKKQKTLDNAFNKEHYDMAHKMWARAFVSAGIPFTCVEDSNFRDPWLHPFELAWVTNPRADTGWPAPARTPCTTSSNNKSSNPCGMLLCMVTQPAQTGGRM